MPVVWKFTSRRLLRLFCACHVICSYRNCEDRTEQNKPCPCSQKDWWLLQRLGAGLGKWPAHLQQLAGQGTSWGRHWALWIWGCGANHLALLPGFALAHLESLIWFLSFYLKALAIVPRAFSVPGKPDSVPGNILHPTMGRSWWKKPHFPTSSWTISEGHSMRLKIWHISYWLFSVSYVPLTLYLCGVRQALGKDGLLA